MAAAQKRDVFGTGQNAASVILDLQAKQHAALKERIAKEKMGIKVYTGLVCPLSICTCACCVKIEVLLCISQHLQCAACSINVSCIEGSKRTA